MKKFMLFGVILSVLFSGCANLSTILSEDANATYNFRKTRWGFTQERVELTEQGKRIHFRQRDVLIYKSSIAGVPALLVYTFKDNKLRTAGYVTQKPLKAAKNITIHSQDVLGPPTSVLADGMMWKKLNSIIYAHSYTSHVTVGSSTYRNTTGGVLSHLPLNLPQGSPGNITRSDGVWSYIDRAFYNELQEMNYPLGELSFYEKLLFGIVQRRGVSVFGMEGGRSFTIPNQ